MSNFKVHRVRFVPYEPQAIHCLAVEAADQPRLAVSRADSSIEIWRISEHRYFREMKFPGCDGTSVEALAWSGSRLFSSGLHGEISEWDFNKLCVKKSVDSYGGAVWSLAVNQEQSLMAAGCEDGCVRLFNITSDELEFGRIFSKQEGRILSVCWHKDGQVLVAGGSDGTIRVYEVSTGHARLRITLDNFAQRNTLVWALAVTSDFTIISGDSLGNTQFWDGKFGTLIKKFNVHIADVLAICINKSEDAVYSSGVDNKLMQFKLIVDKDGNKTWTKSVFTKVHTHDIRALALIRRKKGKRIDKVLVSGGVDTSIVTYDNVPKSYGESDSRRIPAFAQMTDMHLASKAEIIMYQKPTSLNFWKLGKPVNEEFLHLEENPSHLLQIDAKGPHHIICSAVSEDGIWTSYSDIHHLCIFKLNLATSGASTTVQMMKSLPDNLIPAHHMKFTTDSSKLITVSKEKTLQIIDLVSQPISVDTLELPVSKNEIDQREIDPCSPVSVLAVSEDGTLCACSDTACCINVFDINQTKHVCSLPRLASQITAMAFQPGTNTLVMATCKKEIFMFNTSDMKMTDLTNKPDGTGIPTQWLSQPAKVTRILFDRQNPNNIILHSSDMITLIDISKPLPSKKHKLFTTQKERIRNIIRHKRKHEEMTGEKKDTQEQQEPRGQKVTKSESFRVCRKYKPLLFLGVNEDNSLVVVERSWLSIMDTLPPTLHRKKYGT